MSSPGRSGADVTGAELIGGPERRRLVLVDHDPAWATRFETERLRIVTALAGVLPPTR